MNWHVIRVAATVAALVLVTLAAGAVAAAVSGSDIAYYDGFQDMSGLDATQTSNVQIDALGGLRMVTNGAAVTTAWTTTTDFTTPAAPLGPIYGYSTLDATGDTLKLPSAAFGFRRMQADPVLDPSAKVSVDGYSVGGMSVQRVSGDGGKYYMWYAGVPENEYAQRIYLATSTNGVTWTKETTPVLDLGAAGSFDSRQLTKPSVIYDPSNAAAPFRMWYAAEDEAGGGVGYATSLDGRAWTKVGEVLEPGLPGTADSYRVMQPCVLFDNGVYYMWYTADDSNNRRVAYATSVDGLTWARGGVVFDVGTGNYSEGAFAPTVVKLGTDTPDNPSDDSFHMLFTGNKIVSGTDIQSKIINADSDDGLNWAAGNIAFSASGSGTAFDGHNVSQPTILSDPADTAHPHKMWYVGNNPDANGNYHDRIGLAYPKSASSVSQWNKYTGPSGDPYYESVVTLGAQSAAFDSMKVADLRPVAKPSPLDGWYGFYTGVNAKDFVSRIGVRQSADGLSWTTVGSGSALFGGDAAGSYDDAGVACPAPVVNPGGGWWVYHTALSTAGFPSIGMHTVPSDLSTSTASATAVLAGGSGFDASGQADPSAVRGGSTTHVFYAGKSSGGVWSLGRASATTLPPAPLSAGTQILFSPSAETYDAGGMRKPVAEKLASGGWRLFYTAIDADGVKRIAYATSSDGTTWVKAGLVLSPSTDGYDFTEGGVEPAAATAVGATGEDLYFTGSDRFGWTRVGKVSATGPGYVPSGSATYQLDNTGPRDWRRISWSPADPTPAGTSREIWVSYFPTLSGKWSNAYQVTSDTDLPFPLTVQDMRWQVRMKSDTTDTPTLEQLSIDHAPVRFPTTATAVTVPVGPPAGRYVVAWGEMTVTADQPGGTGVKVEVRDEAGAQVVAPQSVTSGSLTIPLGSVAPLGGRLKAVLTFTGDGSATAKVKSLSASYTSTDLPSGMTLAAAPTPVVCGASSTLTGQLLSGAAPLAGQTVTVKQYAPGTGYVDVGTATTLGDGSFSLVVKPTANTTYSAIWPGVTSGPTLYPPASATAIVQVKPKIALRVTKYDSRKGKYYLYKLGRTAYVKGAVTPNHAKLGDGVTTGKVTVTAYLYKKATRKWARVKGAVRSLTTTSTYSWTWKPKARGTYRLTTSFAGDVDHLPTVSAFRYVKVY